MPRPPIDASEASRLIFAEGLMRQYRAVILLKSDADIPSPDKATRSAFAKLGLPNAPGPNQTHAEVMQSWLKQRVQTLLANLNLCLRRDALDCRNLLCFYFHNVEQFLSNSQLTRHFANTASLHQDWERLTGKKISQPSLQVVRQGKPQYQTDDLLPISIRTATNAIQSGMLLVFDIRKGSGRVAYSKQTPKHPPINKTPAPTRDLRHRLYDEPTRQRFQSLMQHGFAWMAETTLGQDALVKAAQHKTNDWALMRDFALRSTKHVGLSASGDALLIAFGHLALAAFRAGHPLDTSFAQTQITTWLHEAGCQSDAASLFQAFLSCKLLIEVKPNFRVCSLHTALLCLIPRWVEQPTPETTSRDLPRWIGDDEVLLQHLLTCVEETVLRKRNSPLFAWQIVGTLDSGLATRIWPMVQRMAAALERAWQPVQTYTERGEVLRQLKWWLLRHAPQPERDLTADAAVLQHALHAATLDLDRIALTKACEVACAHVDQATQPQFVAPLLHLCDAQPHWRTELLASVLRVNHPAAFRLFLHLLRHAAVPPATTARYITRQCAGEADNLISFDDARNHLAELQQTPNPLSDEVAFFEALLSPTNTPLPPPQPPP